MDDQRSRELAENSLALEKLQEANEDGLKRLIEYELSWQVEFDKLDALLEELKQNKAKENGSFLLPKTPAPKRKGRTRKAANESNNETTASTRSSRSSRAASRAATSKITASVEDLNLSKKKRQPSTAAKKVDVSANKQSTDEEIEATTEEVKSSDEKTEQRQSKKKKSKSSSKRKPSVTIDISGVEPIAQSIASESGEVMETSADDEERSIPVVSEHHSVNIEPVKEAAVEVDGAAVEVVEVNTDDNLADAEDNASDNKIILILCKIFLKFYKHNDEEIFLKN